jgi:hypothetical protein
VTGFAPAAEFNGGEAAGPALAAIFQPLHTQKSKNLKKLKTNDDDKFDISYNRTVLAKTYFF